MDGSGWCQLSSKLTLTNGWKAGRLSLSREAAAPARGKMTQLSGAPPESVVYMHMLKVSN